MRKLIVITSPNITVTKLNFDIIIEAGRLSGLSVVVCKSYKEAKQIGTRDDIYALSGNEKILLLLLNGRKNVINWVQGIIPEESFMRHQSRIRYKILSIEEKLALKYSRACLFVSEPMKEHFENKYSLRFNGKSYFFPCFNTNIDNSSFDSNTKYKNNYFVYAGGLAVWQCFDKTLDIYKVIEDWGLPNTKLIVLTKDKERAQQLISERNIKNYMIDYTTPENLPNILKEAKFGFVIRENSSVNRVATPTKLSTYLSCGLIPIYGKSVETFHRLSISMTYRVEWDDTLAAYNRVRDFMIEEIDPKLIKKEYLRFFEENYSRERHISSISMIINEML